MIKRLVLAAVVLAAIVCLPTTTSAAPLVSINPTFQAGNIGDVFSVDIVVSGLEGKAVGSFDLDITFDNVILVGQSFAFGGGLGGPGDVLDLSNGFLGGSIDLAVVSLLSASDLLTLQGGATFTLGTLTFLGATNGLSPLNITQCDLCRRGRQRTPGGCRQRVDSGWRRYTNSRTWHAGAAGDRGRRNRVAASPAAAASIKSFLPAARPSRVAGTPAPFARSCPLNGTGGRHRRVGHVHQRTGPCVW